MRKETDAYKHFQYHLIESPLFPQIHKMYLNVNMDPHGPFCKLMGTDESEKNRFYFQDLGVSRYCNTRKMPRPLIHDTISNYPLGRWCLLFCHVTFLMEDFVSGKKQSIFFRKF